MKSTPTFSDSVRQGYFVSLYNWGVNDVKMPPSRAFFIAKKKTLNKYPLCNTDQPA